MDGKKDKLNKKNMKRLFKTNSSKRQETNKNETESGKNRGQLQK
jgi:hypothetical protein